MPSGVAMGLAWTALGGKTLVVEARGRVPASNARAAQGVSRVVQREEKIGLTGEEWPDRWKQVRRLLRCYSVILCMLLQRGLDNYCKKDDRIELLAV